MSSSVCESTYIQSNSYLVCFLTRIVSLSPLFEHMSMSACVHIISAIFPNTYAFVAKVMYIMRLSPWATLTVEIVFAHMNKQNTHSRRQLRRRGGGRGILMFLNGFCMCFLAPTEELTGAIRFI